MKHQTSRQPTDERDKLRRFRELDDAFSEALRQLDDPDNDFDIPTGPPVRSLADLEREEHQERQEQQQEERQREFERRLHDLMADYALSADTVRRLLTSLASREGVGE